MARLVPDFDRLKEKCRSGASRAANESLMPCMPSILYDLAHLWNVPTSARRADKVNSRVATTWPLNDRDSNAIVGFSHVFDVVRMVPRWQVCLGILAVKTKLVAKNLR